MQQRRKKDDKRKKPTNPKDAIGSSKPPISTVSFAVMGEVGVGMLEGACKYSRHNYRAAGVRASVYFDAAVLRHLGKWWEGEDIDPDSGLSHVTKAIACLMVLRDSMIQGNWIDDRPPKTPADFWKGLNDATHAVLSRYPNPQPPTTALGLLFRRSADQQESAKSCAPHPRRSKARAGRRP